MLDALESPSGELGFLAGRIDMDRIAAAGHSAGGGVVKATVTGSNEIVSVEIDPSVIDPEDPEMLGDLVVAAVNQAIKNAADAAQQSLGGLAGGLDLGGLLG